jgi:NAD(P)-dependent dehydrogenase (short-subunit alcohol dehydrogenase family)
MTAVASLGAPLGRITDPTEVALALCFLAKRQARYITGAARPVDGGQVGH